LKGLFPWNPAPRSKGGRELSNLSGLWKTFGDWLRELGEDDAYPGLLAHEGRRLLPKGARRKKKSGDGPLLLKEEVLPDRIDSLKRKIDP
jgi:hypothetical protein